MCVRHLKAKLSGTALAAEALVLHQQTFPSMETQLDTLGWELLVELGEDSYRADWPPPTQISQPSIRKRTKNERRRSDSR